MGKDMAKASINFKVAQPNSKSHNERLTELDYNFPELSRNNETWKTDEIDARLKFVKSECKRISGRKLQTNAEPIREAVVNLNGHHTMEDLKKLANDLQKKKGLRCFQIHIHRDEGKSREDLNYHAHMLFDWTDQKTGNTLKLTKVDFSQIQTIVAQSLNMERGELKVNSNRERLEPIEYKRQQEELRLEKLQSEVMELEQKKNAAASTYRSAQQRYGSIDEVNRKLRETTESSRPNYDNYTKIRARIEELRKQVATTEEATRKR
jgi:tetrahydromethanopterin S-methyltransferase subunit G